MAKISLGRQFRSIKRAVNRVHSRRIKSGLAVRLIGRSCWRITHALIVVGLLLFLATIVLSIMLSGSAIRKLRGYGDLARSK